MNHAEVVKLLPWYLNSTLVDREANQVQEHVDTCEVCQAELQQLTILQEAVRETSEQESFVSSDNLFNRLMERIDAEKPDSWYQRFKGRLQEWVKGQILVPVAAAFLLLIVGYQSLVVIPGLENQVQRLSEVQSTLSVVLPPAVRGTASEIMVGQEDRFLHLMMDINSPQSWELLLCRFVLGESEMVLEERVDFTSETLNLLVPVSKMPAGEYTLIILGQNAGEPGESEIGRYRFNLIKN